MHPDPLAGGPRIAPLEAPFDEASAAAIEELGPPIALFRLLARRPDRAHGIHGWGSYYLSRRSALSLRHRELAIDRTTALCGAQYELAIHLDVFAERANLTPPQQRSLATGNHTDACWTDAADRAVLRAVDALHLHSDLDDEQWHELRAHLDEEAVLDLLLIAGWYHAISYVANATRLPTEPRPRK